MFIEMEKNSHFSALACFSIATSIATALFMLLLQPTSTLLLFSNFSKSFSHFWVIYNFNAFFLFETSNNELEYD